MFKEPKNILHRAAFFAATYALAVLLAFLLSLVVAIVLAISDCPISALCAVTGFLGVFLPSVIVPQPSRWFCALFLLVLGAGFYYFRFIKQQPGEDPEVTLLQPASSLLPLILGGIGAVIIHWLLRHTDTTPEPKPEKPAGG